MYEVNKNQENNDTVISFKFKPIRLVLDVTDPVSCRELGMRTDDEVRQNYALTALSLGIIALRETSGQAVEQMLELSARRFLEQLRTTLDERQGQWVDAVKTTFAENLDPEKGTLNETLDDFLGDAGQLRKMLNAYVGPDGEIAKTITQFVGDNSEFAKKLDPQRKDSLLNRFETVLLEALEQQRSTIMKEFSKDNKSSAINSFLYELEESHGKFSGGLDKRLQQVLKEFSLDDPKSGLSRLVARVDQQTKKITDEFSKDNADSAIVQMSKMLEETSQQIDKHLDLNFEDSGLSRLKREFEQFLKEILASQNEFRTEVSTALASITASRKERQGTTRGGLDFENEVGNIFAEEARRLGDLFEATGARDGKNRAVKKGDHVITLGPESPAPGARFVIEAKEEQKWTEQKAIMYSEEARKNRNAQIAVFVLSRKSAPEGMRSFARYGKTIIIIWDADDRSSDLPIEAAYSVARALLISQSKTDNSSVVTAIANIEQSARSLEKQLKATDEIRKASDLARHHSEKAFKASDDLRNDIQKHIDTLDEQIAALKAEKEEN